MSIDRKLCRNRSNNNDNPNQNVCVQAVAKYFKVDDEVRYLHCLKDLVRALRMKHTVRSRTSQVKGKSIGKIRAKLPQMAAEVNAIAFLARVDKHVLTLSTNGETLTDTDPRQRDKRKITHLYIIY